MSIAYVGVIKSGANTVDAGQILSGAWADYLMVRKFATLPTLTFSPEVDLGMLLVSSTF